MSEQFRLVDFFLFKCSAGLFLRYNPVVLGTKNNSTGQELQDPGAQHRLEHSTQGRNPL